MKVVKSSKKDKVDFGELKSGDCFLDGDGDLMMKTDHAQDAVQLDDGCIYTDLCGDEVTLVNTEARIID